MAGNDLADVGVGLERIDEGVRLEQADRVGMDMQRIGIVVQHDDDRAVHGLGKAGTQPVDLHGLEHAVDAAGFGRIKQDDAVAVGVDDLVDLAGFGGKIGTEDVEEDRTVVVIAKGDMHRDGQMGDNGLEALVSGGFAVVGQIAGQIARIKGLDPVAIAGTDEKIAWCRELGYRTGINHRTTQDIVADVAEACPDGVDVFLDNTAGPAHDAAMLNLNVNGRVVVVGTIALADRFDEPDIGMRHLRQIMIKRACIQGFLLDDFEADYTTAKADLLSWYRQGLLKTREDVSEGIETVPEAFTRMLRGENFGKQLVRLD